MLKFNLGDPKLNLIPGGDRTHNFQVTLPDTLPFELLELIIDGFRMIA